MKLGRGRVIKRGDYQALGLEPLPAQQPPKLARIAPKPIVDASLQASLILAKAEQQALDVRRQAEQTRDQLRLEAEARGRADATAALAARALRLRCREAETEQRGLDQLVVLARALAERLLGEELQLDPTRIVALAKQALAEARGARRVLIEAHPEDASALETSLPALGISEGTVSIKVDNARQRGNLRIVTEVGVLDAALEPQLEHLTRKLRETLAT